MCHTPFQHDLIEQLSRYWPVYIVGGAVRDELLGFPANDLDAVIPRPLDDIEGKVRELGYIPHRLGARKETVSIFSDQKRIDLVELVSDLPDDAKRRDFTVNAIYYDVQKAEWIDPLNGRGDLESRRLRSCENPRERLAEDPVRILRMVRMAVKYGLKIEQDLWRAASDGLALLDSCPAERVTAELKEILLLDETPAAVEMLDELGYFRRYVPELARLKGLVQNKYHTKDAWEHTLHVFANTPPRLLLRLAGLFHDIGKWETASRECRVWGQLEQRGKELYVNGLNIKGKVYPAMAGSYLEVIGGRLDNYPDTVVAKRVRASDEHKSGFEWVPDGKRHFLRHEQESGKLLKQILPRYRWSMFLKCPGRHGEQELIMLVRNHMLGTLIFMNELRDETINEKEIAVKARRLAWETGWDGHRFFRERVTDFLALWKADFWGGKARDSGDGARFDLIQNKVGQAAEELEQNWRSIDWRLFESYAKEKKIGGERFGRFKAQVRRSLLIAGQASCDYEMLEREFKMLKHGR